MTPTDDDYDWLRQKKWPKPPRCEVDVRVVDLFSGAGGMSLGAFAAAVALGRGFEVALAVEKDATVARIYQENFEQFCTTPGSQFNSKSIEELFDGCLGTVSTSGEKKLQKRVGKVDLLMGGPPCQGHSDLNNRTRRNDVRNSLYERMARAAEVLRPRAVIVENVPAVVHAAGGVVDRAQNVLRDAGYGTARVVLAFNRLGVPQSRKRHVLLAVKRAAQHDVTALADRLMRAPTSVFRDVRWAIGDLAGQADEAGSGGFDAPAKPNAVNEQRLAWFETNPNQWVLPNEERPDCHKQKRHSYKSVYGRMRWEHPAQTVTTGFGCMGQGCYVHPTESRTITPHEAARLQTFPDFFEFSSTSLRTVWAKAIGNAVPPLGMSRVVMQLLEFLDE